MTTHTTIITNQPISGGTIIMKTEREFSTGLFGCFEDMGSCLCAFCCTPCFECMVSSAAQEFVCIPLCVPGAMIAVRAKLRAQYGIRGSICNDCLTYACCGPCTLAQMQREMDNVRQGRI